MMGGHIDEVIWSVAMEPEEIQKHISVDPQVCHGQACVRGTRVLVSEILDALAAGETTSRILRNYPGVTQEGIRACIAYAALLTHEQVVILQP